MKESAERIHVSARVEEEQIPGKFIYLFPGQGVQRVGMGKTLYDSSEIARGIFDQLEPGLLEIMLDDSFEGSADAFDDTAIAQPAIVAVSLATYFVFLEKNPSFKERLPLAFLGHSTGQMSVLRAAGVVDTKTALHMAVKRGKLMQEIGQKEENKGGMVALLGGTLEQAVALCANASQEFGKEGMWIANDNTIGQTVLSGRENYIVYAMAQAREVGIKKAVRLPVSIAAHCPLMQEAQDLFAEYLDHIKFEEPTSPIILNTSAAATLDPDEIKADLISGLTCGVKFREALQEAQRIGVTNFVEIGEGPLSDFAKRAMPDLKRVQIAT